MPPLPPPNSGALRSLVRMVVGAALAVAFFVAQPLPVKGGLVPLIIRDDPGGDISARADQIRNLRQSGRRVEIKGAFCLSACTMYLGLANLCIAPNVRFGFHGPGSAHYGIALARAEYEHWSRVMASFYPPDLRKWFMQTGRTITVGFYEFSGRDLIKTGIAQCA